MCCIVGCMRMKFLLSCKVEKTEIIGCFLSDVILCFVFIKKQIINIIIDTIEKISYSPIELSWPLDKIMYNYVATGKKFNPIQ